jgi:hypothetical protein
MNLWILTGMKMERLIKKEMIAIMSNEYASNMQRRVRF